MRILFVNPNSTASMTAKIEAAALSVANPATEIIAVNPEETPASIEGHYDEALAVPPMLELFQGGFAAGSDAGVVACFDDPGLYAVRSITDRPVLGVCEAAMLTASIVASRFSVVTTLVRAVPVIEELAHRYGMAGKCRRVRAANVPVLALETPGSGAQHRVQAEVERAVADDGAEAVLLGCVGMADLARTLTERVGVPVIDGVAAATRLAEALAGLGVRTSKVGGFGFPLAKAIVR